MKNENAETYPTSRMTWVDYGRGLAIILVLYRHIIVGLEYSGVHIPGVVFNIQEITLNFRMPMFFMLSGCFLLLTLKKRSAGNVFNKKAKNLLHPYLLWTFILVSFQIIFSNFTNANRTPGDYLYIILQPRELDHMWYLLALFNTSAIFLLLWRHIGQKPVLNFAIAIGLHFLSFALKDISLLSDPFYHYIFLLTGAYMPKYLLWLENKSTSFFLKLFVAILPVFVLGQYFWFQNRDEPVLYALPLLVVIVVAFMFFYSFCKILQSLNIAKWLMIIGKNSLYIYILHLYIIAAFRVLCLNVLSVNNLAILITGSLLFGIIIPVYAYWISQKLNLWFLFSLSRPVQLKTINGS